MIQATYCAAVDFRFSCNEGNQVSWKQSYYQIVSKRIRFNFGPVIFLNAIAMHFLLFYRDKAAKKLSLVRGVTCTTDDWPCERVVIKTW